MEVTLFAVREKGTDNFLPQQKRKRGWTNDEPEPNGGVHGPRLFHTRRSALNALTCWKLGAWTKWVNRPTGFDHGDYDEGVDIVKQPHRTNMVMEVVPITLIAATA